MSSIKPAPAPGTFSSQAVTRVVVKVESSAAAAPAAEPRVRDDYSTGGRSAARTPAAPALPAAPEGAPSLYQQLLLGDLAEPAAVAGLAGPLAGIVGAVMPAALVGALVGPELAPPMPEGSTSIAAAAGLAGPLAGIAGAIAPAAAALETVAPGAMPSALDGASRYWSGIVYVNELYQQQLKDIMTPRPTGGHPPEQSDD